MGDTLQPQKPCWRETIETVPPDKLEQSHHSSNPQDEESRNLRMAVNEQCHHLGESSCRSKAYLQRALFQTKYDSWIVFR